MGVEMDGEGMIPAALDRATRGGAAKIVYLTPTMQNPTTATMSAERRERILPEEEGGPFVRTRASQEFAYDFDESNIAEATREPLPKTSLADP